jgi:acyl-[acyl-carrier-protein]-phospholipid O-acyltransferase/long-chain-fatty-acid--[acyl-carrier-protein] ligase
MLLALVRTVLRLLFRVRVTGLHHGVKFEKTLIVANHESFLDGILLGLFLPVDATYVVHTEIARNFWFSIFLRRVKHLAVDPTNPLAMKQILRLIESGEPVAIFPEGRITVTGSLMKVYDGSAFLATRTGATVVPVRIEGASQTYFSRLAGVYPRSLLPRLSLHVLAPRTMAMPEGETAKIRRRKSGEAMRRVLQEMVVATRPAVTIYESFLHNVRNFGRRYKLVEDLRLVEESYGSLLKSALGLQRIVRRLTAPDERVGLLLPNATVTMAMVLAITGARRVPAMLNYTAGQEGIRAAIQAAQIRRIFTSRAFVEKAKLESLLTGLGSVEIAYLEDLRATFGWKDRLWVLACLVRPQWSVVPQSPDAAAVVLFTSGSEGQPKGVVHTHRSILANVAQVRAVSDFMPSDKFLVSLPLFHSFGFTCGTILPLVAGCKVFLYPSPLHYRIIPEVVYDRRCTVLFGTSTFLANYGKFAHPYDFARLRYVVAGAEKLADGVRQAWFERFGIRILEGYGSTECAPVIAVNTPMAYRTGSVGQLAPGMNHRLEAVPGVSTGGRLHVSGPNVMAGYLRVERPGVLEPTVSDGKSAWYDTGDIVEIDPDGFVFIRGRAKRFAKIGGEMISLAVVESLAALASPDSQHAAISIPHAGKGEALVLFTADNAMTRERLQEAARGSGAPELAVPRDIRFLEKIPVLGTGKTDYARLQKEVVSA